MKSISTAVCFALGASQAMASNIYVDDRAALAAAIKTARSGDVIILAPGAYGDLLIAGRNFSPALVLKAADRADPPRFVSVRAKNGGGLHLHDIDVVYGATSAPLTTYAVYIDNVDDFAITGSTIISSADGIRTNDAYGMFVRDSDSVLIERNSIHDVFRGIAVFEIEDGLVRENVISKAGSDGIVGRGLVNVVIEANIIKGFDVIDPVTHHPDGIQIWSREAQRRTQNVSIIRNVILRGVGDRFQGILIGTDELPADGLVIENNVIHQSMPQGIYVERAKNVELNNNTVTAFDWEADRPGIEIRNPAGTTSASNNIAGAYRIASSVAQSNNVEIDFDNPWLETYAGTLMYSAFEGANATPKDFRPKTIAGAKGFIEVDVVVDDEPHHVKKNIRAHSAEIIDFTFDNQVIDGAEEAITFTGIPAGFGRENETGFATFNGLRSQGGGAILTSEVSPKASSANDLTIDARVRRPASTGWQILAVVPNAYEVRFNGTDIRLSIWNAEGEVKRVTAVDTGIADGQWHNIRLRYVAQTGLTQVIVDGIVKAAGNGPGGRIAYQPGQRLYVGGSPWIASFKGDVERLAIRR